MKPLSFICRTRSKSGFTLVETLVVVTIFGIIAVGIASTFASGVKLWNRAKNINFSRAELLLNMEKISRELRQSIYVEKIGFEGTAEEVSFPAVINNATVKVIYKFKADEKTLLRREIKSEDGFFQDEEEGWAEEGHAQKVLLSSLDEF